MRIALGLEYNGSPFAGWQNQLNQPSVQSALQKALSEVANENIEVFCAGRTDAGVHATGQIVHFDTSAVRPLRAWVMGANTLLPDTIRVLWSRIMPADFHARASALARYYRYEILNRPMHSALQSQQLTWCYRPLDIVRMQQGADFLVGHHDFTSFRALHCQSRSPRRMMYFVNVTRQNDRVTISLGANAFVHHMVRNIAGSLMDVGSGKYPPEWIHHVMHARDRRMAGMTAPPHGLYLAGVHYPVEYALPIDPVFGLLPDNVRRYQALVDDDACSEPS